ncbi:hypothetical protein [Flavobacterium wongokense]|uniref:hypothetical protein n=1 Tax=Flavobacterium wongokense TaxID=2910674 RepID=UPI001F248392|nr:hypothetical protein [Flavobacterium sp. WG47]MCF6131935.1 hypothetical protein [Flavobacterium sp. WG47]
MKAEKSISAYLGFTQEELAMLLLVQRSQLSMYELGLRPLPSGASQRLAEIIAATGKLNPSGLLELHAEKQSLQHKELLGKMLKDNEYQQYAMSLKIAVLEQKIQTNLKSLHVIQQLIGKEVFGDAFRSGLLSALESKRINALQKHSTLKLAEYQMKLKALQLEEKLLRGAMEK